MSFPFLVQSITAQPTNANTTTVNPTPSPTSAGNDNPTAAPMPVVDTSSPTSPTSLLQEDEYTYIGPGFVECTDRGICMFDNSLAEECNLISLLSISNIRTDEDLNLVVHTKLSHPLVRSSRVVR